MYRIFLFAAFLLMLGGCVTNHYVPGINKMHAEAITGVGYAVIAAQSGQSEEEKRLMAAKASKLEAYKSLVEQIYGQYIEVNGLMSSSKVVEESLRSKVEGIIYGAELVSIRPVGGHSYETTLRIGGEAVADLVAGSEAGSQSGAAGGD